MNAYMMLCDYAQVSQGKLYIIGGGWDRTTTANPNIGLAVDFLLEWTETNQKHTFEIELQNEDGETITSGVKAEPIRIKGEFTVGRPAEHPAGMPIGLKHAFNFPNVPLKPSARYRWELRIDDNPEAFVAFYTVDEKTKKA